MPTHEWTRVVVLRTAPQEPRDERLSAIFAARDWFAIEHTNPYQAMAELCLRERAQVSRSAWGLQRVEKTALVIEGTGNSSQVHDLVHAVTRYLPGATVWSYFDSELAPIGDHTHARISESEHRVSAQASPRPIPKPWIDESSPPSASPGLHAPPSSALHAAPVASRPQSPDAQESAEEPTEPAGRITREEIDMLLRADLDDSSPLPFAPSRQHRGGAGSGS